MNADSPKSLSDQRREQKHAAAKAKLKTETERLACDIGRELGKPEAALRIMAAARQFDRPISDDDPVEAEAILEHLYQELEMGKLSLDRANNILASLKSQYEARPL